jgi:hypothetical protein
MSYSTDPNLKNQDDDLLLEGEAEYPVAFGITFTPQVSGIALALLGLVGAGYVLVTFFMPALTEYNALKADEVDKQDQINRQKSGEIDQKMLQAETDLKQSEALRNQVLSLFSSEASLKTLLLDINTFVDARQVELLSFKPTGTPTVVNDGSLGETVNNRLKRQSFQLEVEGTFEKTHELLQDLERLQPLLIIKQLNSQRLEETFEVKLINNQTSNGGTSVQGQVVPQGMNKVKTTFTLDAILPLTPEEVAELAPPPAEAAEGETPENGQ